MTAVVVAGKKGKEYRLPEKEELQIADVSWEEVERTFADIPSGNLIRYLGQSYKRRFPRDARRDGSNWQELVIGFHVSEDLLIK